MKKSTLIIAGLSFVLTGCATMYSAAELDKMAKEAVEKSFVEKGIAKKERINQDAINLACTSAELSKTALSGEATRKLEAAEYQAIKYPADGKFLGDWKVGERVAQGGGGSTYSD
ncbi:MAG: sulfur oxidation c-type cytochrome SoxX, partial [Burkholderiales bacterium]